MGTDDSQHLAQSSRESKKKQHKGSNPPNEARREQNRVASRIYRQRRKQRLALLEQLLQSGNNVAGEGEGEGDAPLSSQPSPGPRAISSGPREAAEPVPTPLISGPTPALPSGLVPPDSSVVLPDEPHMFESALDRSPWTHPVGQPLAGAGVTAFRTWVSQPYQPTVSSTNTYPSAGVPSRTIIPSPTPPNLTFLSLNQSAPGHGILPVNSNDSVTPTVITNIEADLGVPWGPHVIRGSSPGGDTGGQPAAGYLSHRMMKTLACFSRLSIEEKNQVLSIIGGLTDSSESSDSQGQGSPGDRIPQSPSAGGTNYPSDGLEGHQRGDTAVQERLIRVHPGRPPMNESCSRMRTLRLTKNGFFGAIFQNAIAVGYPTYDVLLQYDATSLYSAQPVHLSDSGQLNQLRVKFANITKDLQPVDSQFTMEHHPYLDVIPFPNFRRNAIAATMCEPPILDEDQLCFDFQSDGLICWGSLLGRQGGSDMGSSVPWDMRSWEPSVWFLKKYWYLVGGWDDEMWSSARWWHSIRGEKLDLGGSVSPIPGNLVHE